MISAFISRQFMLFLMTGTVAAVINFFSRIFFNQWLSYSFSIIIAYLTGMVCAFILARLIVFKKSNQSLQMSAFLFALVNVIAVAQTWVISIGMIDYLLPVFGVTRYAPEIAHAAGVIFPVFSSYLGHKHWSFR